MHVGWYSIFCKRKLLSVIKVVVDIRNADARIQTGNLIKRKQMSWGEGQWATWKAKPYVATDLGPYLSTWPLTILAVRQGPGFWKGKWSTVVHAARWTHPLQGDLGRNLSKALLLLCLKIIEDNLHTVQPLISPCFIIRCFPEGSHTVV